MSIKSEMLSNHLILCCRLLLLLSIFPSIRVFSNESALCIRWPKYWSFSFSNSPSNKYSELISFRIDWFDLLAVQGALKNLLQPHTLKASILWSAAFFMIQLSHLYMTTGKIIALIIWTTYTIICFWKLSNYEKYFWENIHYDFLTSKWNWKCQSLSHLQWFAALWTVAHQAPLSMEFSRQEYWNGLRFPSPGIFPTQGSNLGLPHCRQILYCLSHREALKSKQKSIN